MSTPPDIVSRIVASALSESEGWSVVVENKPGAVQTLGATEVLKQPADGYTILAVGTPVITSDFASLAELGQDGGTVLVDPRDDDALVEAMRCLLTDDLRLETLRSEARSRPVTTWEGYASRLWDVLVAPELDVLAAEGSQLPHRASA